MGLPPGLTLGVNSKLVAYTVTPRARTGIEERDGKLEAGPLGDDCIMVGLEEVSLEAIVPP